MISEPLLSIVVPTLNEERTLPGLLLDLSSLAVPHEIVVSDGGSVDATLVAAERSGACIVSGPAGRGIQLRAGADAASGALLCFLHADIRLSGPAVDDLARLATEPPAHSYAFRLRIESRGLAFRMIEAGTNLRGRCMGLPFGDQGLIVTRTAYDAAGGYPAIPLMEDVALVRALRREPGIRLLKTTVTVSARRWEREGPFRRTFLNQMLLARYLVGEDPHHLVRRYLPERNE